MENNKESRAAFAAILQGLIINSSVKYRTPEEEKAVFKFYFGALRHLELDEVRAAAKNILETWKWNRLPTVGEILENVPGSKPMEIEDAAAIQAALVMKILRTEGANCTPNFEDPITKWIMNSRWSYQEWGSQVIQDELKWWVHEFKKLYRAVSEGGNKKYLDFTPRNKIKEPEVIGDVIVRALPKMGGKNVTNN